MEKRPPPPQKAPKPGAIKAYLALYSFQGEDDELTFEEGDRLYVSDRSNPDWWKATFRGKAGVVPSNYVTEDNTNSIDFPLHEAAKRGNLDYMADCLENNVAINGKDKSGSTALYWASHGGHIPCAAVLIENKYCDVNVQNKLGDTPLHAAAWKSHPEIVELLLSKNANLSLKNIEDKTPFDLATDPATAALLKPRSRNSISSATDEYLDDSD